MEARLSRTRTSPWRDLIAACRSAAALALLGAAARGAAAEQGPPFTLQQLAPGVYAAIDRDARAGANAGFVIGDDGVAIVDSFQYPEAAESLLAEIRKLTPLPVRYVINTHYHIDHVAGDGVFKGAGALVVAQRNVLASIRTENLKFFGADQREERALVEGLPLPDLLVDQELTIRLGARRLELRALPGHSGSDLVVAVSDAKVLFCGDLFWRRVAPSLIDATVSKWTETVEGLQHRPDAAAYTYVPGQGDVATLADVGDFEHYLEDLTETVRTAMGSDAKGDDLVATALPPLKAKYGTWGLFEHGAPREIPFMAAELSGTKRVPPAQPGADW
jgi:cyclase